MYNFVKGGSRLFMKGSRRSEDADNVQEISRSGHRLQSSNHHEDSVTRRYAGKSQLATASAESREVFRSHQNRSGLKTVQTQRVFRKTTTVSRGEKISDIIHHDETISFKEALLRWAQRTTEGYPGVRVTNFTDSWRDGLAFNAILHRNRPDLLDFKACKTRTARENLENAFEIAERDLGVTRLLDPEDVDTHTIDEKSMITYLVSLYELFPEPPSRNPLLEDEKLKKIEEYRDSATRLLLWIRECTGRFNDRDWPNTIHEMKSIQRDHDIFRTEEIPPKQREKQRLAHAYREVSKLAVQVNAYLDHELSSDNVDILWNRMLTAHQEREQAIIEELLRQEKMQRLAEKVLREIKQCDMKLDSIERTIKDEERRAHRLHPLDSKINCDEIEVDLRTEEDRIKNMFTDVQTLREGRYHKVTELHNSVQQLHQRWSDLQLWLKKHLRLLQIFETLKTVNDWNYPTYKAMEPSQRDSILNALEDDISKLIRERPPNDPYSNRLQDELRAIKKKFADFEARLRDEDNEKSLRERARKMNDKLLQNIRDCERKLDEKERRLDQLSTIPTDQEKIRQKIAEHKRLHEEIVDLRPDIEQLTESAQELMSLVGDDEAQPIVEKVSEVTDRYVKLVDDSLNLGHRLAEAHEGLASFVLSFEDLLQWIDKMDTRLDRFRALSIFMDQLREEITELQDINGEIRSRQRQVADVMKAGEEIMKTSSGYDIVQVKEKLDALQVKYADLVARGADKLAEARDALRVAEEFHSAHDTLNSWMDDAELVLSRGKSRKDQDLLDSLKLLKEDIPRCRSLLEQINHLGPQLASVSPGHGAATIDGMVSRATRRFDAICDQIQRKSAAIQQRLDDVANSFAISFEDLMQWINKTEARLDHFRALSVFTDKLREQIAQLKGINDEVRSRERQVDDLLNAGEEIMRIASDREAVRVRDKMNELQSKFGELVTKAKNKLTEAQDALPLAEKFHSAHDTLNDWMDDAESTLSQSKIREDRELLVSLKQLESEVPRCRLLLDEIKRLGPELGVISPGQGESTINGIVTRATRRFDAICDQIHRKAASLQQHLNDVADSFALSFEDILQWINKTDARLDRFRSLSVFVDKLREEITELQEINVEIKGRQRQVTDVMKAGEEIMKISSGHDIAQVQERLDALRTKYADLVARGADKLVEAREALRVAEEFHSAHDTLNAWMDDAELTLSQGKSRKDQEQLDSLKLLKEDIPRCRALLEKINHLGPQLASVSPGNGAVTIDGMVTRANRRFDDICDQIQRNTASIQQRLDDMANSFAFSSDDLLQWINKTDARLDHFRALSVFTEKLREQVAQLKDINDEIRNRERQVDDVLNAGEETMRIVSDREAVRVRDKMNELQSKFGELVTKAKNKLTEAQDALPLAEKFHSAHDTLSDWMDEAESTLSQSKTREDRELLSSLKQLESEVPRCRSMVDEIKRLGPELGAISPGQGESTITGMVQRAVRRFESISEQLGKKSAALQLLLDEVYQAYQLGVDEMSGWLDRTEARLDAYKELSVYPDRLFEQISELREINEEIRSYERQLDETVRAGEQIMRTSSDREAQEVRKKLDSLRSRYSSVAVRAKKLLSKAQESYKETKEFFDAWSGLMSWLSEAEENLGVIQSLGNDSQRIKQYLMKHKEFQRALGAKQITYDATMKVGRTLRDKAPKSHFPILQEMLDELKSKWNSVCQASVDRQRKLEEALLFSGQFREAVQALLDWLDRVRHNLSLDNLYGDLDTVSALVEHHKLFQEDLKNRGRNLASVRKTANELLESASAEDASLIRQQLSSLEQNWEEVTRMSDAKERVLQEALRSAEELHKSVHTLLEWLSDAEMKLRFSGPLPDDEETLRQQIAEHEAFMREMSHQERNKDATIRLAEEILSKCHPDAVSTIEHWVTIIKSRWEELTSWAKQRESRLQDHLRSLQNVLDLLEELLQWLLSAETRLLTAEAEPLPDDIILIESLIEEHQTFIDNLTRRQPDVDKIAKAFSSKRSAYTASQAATEVKSRYESTYERSSSRSRTPTSRDRHMAVESDIKNPKARQLLEKWRSVWILAMERMRRLQDKLEFLREVERVKNFDFNEWRRRFLAWNANKKARICDFWKNLDPDNLGRVPIESFIEGFLRSKFPTSRLEMLKVAPIFDRNSDGYIDHKEYLDTLRPDRDHPTTDEDLIQDEVQRQVAKCTCVQKYKVYHVGEGRYRFGESQKLRLVRILRSTVMVRVGGGWVSLDEFLIKNDPCRAKGRTNVELREQFVLAEGVSQGMTPFKSKMHVSTKRGDDIPTMGPITKIREKTERSVPMSRSGYRFGESTSDYSYGEDANNGSKSRPRSRLTPGSGSRPGSRANSRAASDLSAESLNDYQQRKVGTPTRYITTASGMRRTHSFSRTAANGNQERWK